MIKLILFDLDGTFVDTAYDIIEAANKVYINNNKPIISYKVGREIASDGVSGFLKLKFDENKDVFDLLSEEFLSIYNDHFLNNALLFGVLLYSGFSKKKALLLNFLSAAVAIVGAFVGLSIGKGSEEFILYLLPFAAGGFIYIAGSNLIPELHKEYDLNGSLLHLFALVLGIGMMVALLFV